MAGTGYAVGAAAGGPTPGPAPAAQPEGGWPLHRCKRAYLDFLSTKRDELAERTQSRRYRHGAHWTADQVKALNGRKQPIVTYNRIGRKINGVVGLVEKLRLDPKAYPRTPQHEQGAELATASIRYTLDEQEWKAKTPIVADIGATDGLAGVALEIIPGDRGDPEIGIEIVDDDFFYDPRSKRADFSDARYQGVGKWIDLETAQEMFPDKADELAASMENGSELSSQPDSDNKWFTSTADGHVKNVRLVDIWYKHRGEWCWTLFTGSTVLMHGQSYLRDEKGRTECRYLMWSANVDHDGDRYGFVRDLKSANDEINQRRSKGLHELNTRRIIGEVGAFENIEKARTEAARPDGVVLRNKGFEAEFDDTAKLNSLEGQLKFLEDAKNEVENFGPNPALLGQGVEQSSGRAINLLQQAGMAELGPFILAFRAWKLRVYRAVWNAQRQHWTAERWIRVTDDEGLAQFIGINQLQPHPQTGAPTLVNAIGDLDVDIILDEGPDQINMMADVYETLSQVVPAVAQMLSPTQAQAAVQLLIDMSPLPQEAKSRFRGASQPQAPDPAQDAAQRLQMQEAMATIADKQAAARLKEAQAQKVAIEANIAPVQAAHDAALAGAEFQATQDHAVADRAHAASDAEASRYAEAGRHLSDIAHRAEQAHLDRLFQAQQAERGHEQALEQIEAQPAPAPAAQ